VCPPRAVPRQPRRRPAPASRGRRGHAPTPAIAAGVSRSDRPCDTSSPGRRTPGPTRPSTRGRRAASPSGTLRRTRAPSWIRAHQGARHAADLLERGTLKIPKTPAKPHAMRHSYTTWTLEEGLADASSPRDHPESRGESHEEGATLPGTSASGQSTAHVTVRSQPDKHDAPHAAAKGRSRDVEDELIDASPRTLHRVRQFHWRQLLCPLACPLTRPHSTAGWR
jgi:hypothetical protein